MKRRKRPGRGSLPSSSERHRDQHGAERAAAGGEPELGHVLDRARAREQREPEERRRERREQARLERVPVARRHRRAHRGEHEDHAAERDHEAEQRERRQPLAGRERDRGGDAALGRAEPGDERHGPELHGAVERRERGDRREARDRQPDRPRRFDAASCRGRRSARPAASACSRRCSLQPSTPSEPDDARRARIGDRGRAPQERGEQAADDPRHACVPAITATPSTIASGASTQAAYAHPTPLRPRSAAGRRDA